MNKFRLLLRPQNVILNEIPYKEIICWFRCWNLLIIRCIDDNCRFLSLTRCIGFTCILTSFRWIILAKYVKTHGLFTILLKSMLHCLQLIVMHNWTKEYLDWTKRSLCKVQTLKFEFAQNELHCFVINKQSLLHRWFDPNLLWNCQAKQIWAFGS